MSEQLDNQIDTDSAADQNQLEIDPLKMQRFLQKLRDSQSLLLGAIAGLATATICAILWAVITTATNYQIGWMAIGVGVAVGSAVRQFGKGIDTSFGIAGGILSCLGILAGNLFTVILLVAKKEGIPVLDILSGLTLPVIGNVLQATFQPMDAVFYLIGMYEGYQFSFRQTTEEELLTLTKEQPL